MPYIYETEQRVPYPSETVFSFFSDPQNLPKLMEEWQRARIDEAKIISPVPSADGHVNVPAAGVGSRITISFRVIRGLPLRFSWEAEISEFSWEGHFCDRQVKGPFASWNHCHQVRRSTPHQETETTLVKDRVIYELPFGILGDVAHRAFIRRQIRRMFALRHTRLLEILADIEKRC